ncbi:AMP-binding protein [Ideonella sp. DXS29W]|uniref:AMP-binding protein n=1 Tax=Ideonella lacteola TaxID=2984193 RepID=A0ABU9BRK5_9BURK
MNRDLPPAAAPAAHPLQALYQRANDMPAAAALLWQHEGRLHTLSWSELAQRARQAALGWQALGVRPGDIVACLGANGEASVTSLLALWSLGAHLQAPPEVDSPADGSPADSQPRAPFRLALVQGPQQADRLLAQPPAGLEAIVVEHEFGTEPSPRIRTLTWAALLHEVSTRGAPAAAADAANEAPWRVAQDGIWGSHWQPHASTAGQAGKAGGSAAADFEPGWAPAWRWMVNEWLPAGMPLRLSEPGAVNGEALSAETSLWLASGPALNAWAGHVLQRTRGRAATWALGAVRRNDPLTRLLRWRIRGALGWTKGLRMVTDRHASTSTLDLLHALGASVRIEGDRAPFAPVSGARAITRHASHVDTIVPAWTGAPV